MEKKQYVLGKVEIKVDIIVGSRPLFGAREIGVGDTLPGSCFSGRNFDVHHLDGG